MDSLKATIKRLDRGRASLESAATSISVAVDTTGGTTQERFQALLGSIQTACREADDLREALALELNERTFE